MPCLVEKRLCVIAMVSILGRIFWEHLTPKRILFLISSSHFFFPQQSLYAQKMETNQGSVDLAGVIFACKEQKPPELVEAKKVLHFGNHARSEWSGVQWSLIQSLNRVQLFSTPWTAAHQASLSSTISWSLLKFMSIELVTLSNHLILCCPILLSPSIFPSIRGFSNELALHIRWPKYWSFSFSISLLPMNIQGWFPLGLTDLISLLSKGLSRVFSNTTMRKHQLFGSQPSLWSNSHICTWLLEKP